MKYNEPLFSAEDLIHAYTRAEALADGTLVEADPAMAKQAGWKIPVAFTSAVWADIEWDDEDTKRTGIPQDTTGRLWDVLWMGYVCARRHTVLCERDPTINPSVCRMAVLMVPKHGGRLEPVRCEYVVHVGGGDHGDPVVTVMLPGED